MVISLIGVVGAGVILIAFVLNETKKLSSESIVYDGANFLGGVLLSIYAYQLQSYPFLVLNIIWLLVSLRDAVTYLKSKTHKRRIWL